MDSKNQLVNKIINNIVKLNKYEECAWTVHFKNRKCNNTKIKEDKCKYHLNNITDCIEYEEAKDYYG